MTISQLIALLNQAKNLHGDMPVTIEVATNDSFDTILSVEPADVLIHMDSVSIVATNH